MDNTKKFPEWILWCVVIIWGANYTIGKWGTLGFDPISFTVLRFGGSTPVLFALLYWLEKDIRIQLRDISELALLGLLGVTIYQVLFMATVKYASATDGSLLSAIAPVFSAVFAWLAGQERLGKKGCWGSVLSVMGVTLVLLTGTQKLGGAKAWYGDIFGLLSTSLWGLYPVLARRMLNKYSALKTTTYSALFGTVFLLVIGTSSLLKLNWQQITWASYGSLLFSIGPVTAFGLVAWYHGISKIGSNRAMAYMYGVPVAAVFIAAVILGEKIYPAQLAGSAIIFIGITLIHRDKLGAILPDSTLPSHAK